jgi:hypothetical protein
MASLIAPPVLSIKSAQPGFSTIRVTYVVAFDNNDRAVNQPYDDQLRMWQVDKKVGDPASEGADDRFGFSAGLSVRTWRRFRASLSHVITSGPSPTSRAAWTRTRERQPTATRLQRR